jgi:Domain of unknown function (DUF4062)
MSSLPRLRVFVSSVVEGYEAFRAAAAQGIEDAGAQGIRVETLPSLAVSPRNACLDGVGAADAYLVLVGSRAGWTTPSGALATEEEFDEARRLVRPTLAFIQQVPQREPEADRLVRKISDYVSGQFRITFADAQELRAAVARSVRALGETMDLPLSDPNRVAELLSAGRDQSYEASVRVVLVPERLLELVPPGRIDSDDLLQDLYAIGHDRHVRFFEFTAPKESKVSGDGVLTVRQQTDRGRDRNAAAVALSESGELRLDKDIRERDLGDAVRSSHSLVEADLQAALDSAFRFAGRVLDLLDRHERCATVWAGVAVVGSGNRYLYAAAPTGGSVYLRTGDSTPVVAERAPRRLGRSTLRSPEAEIDRLLALFRRSLGPPRGR